MRWGIPEHAESALDDVYEAALLRLVGPYVAGAVFYIGFIRIFVDKRRRGWQDLIAGTVVVKKP